MILVTRSKKKVVGLDGYGIKITKTRNYKMKPKILIVTARLLCKYFFWPFRQCL